MPLVLITVLLLAAIVIVLMRRRRKAARIAAMSPAERELHDAEQDHARAVQTAERDLKNATKAYQKQIKTAERELAQAQRTGQKRLGRYGTVTAWQHQIQTDRGTFPMNGLVRATVDTAGNLAIDRRSTLTRMAAGGLVAGRVGLLGGGMLGKKKIHDTRELYLMVEGEEFATVVDCKPDDAARVRQLAASINNAARTASATAAERESAVTSARARLAAARGNTDSVDAAQRTLDVVQANTSRVEAARAALAKTAVEDPAVEVPAVEATTPVELQQAA